MVPAQLDEMTFALIARFRGHGHLCNVLSHIGSGNWRTIEQAIASILRPRARSSNLNAIARNILELVADGRGTTGPIMRSAFFAAIAGEVGAKQAKRIERKIARLRESMRSDSRRRAEQARERPVAGDDHGKSNQPANIVAHETASWSKAA